MKKNRTIYLRDKYQNSVGYWLEFYFLTATEPNAKSFGKNH